MYFSIREFLTEQQLNRIVVVIEFKYEVAQDFFIYTDDVTLSDLSNSNPFVFIRMCESGFS